MGSVLDKYPIQVKLIVEKQLNNSANAISISTLLEDLGYDVPTAEIKRFKRELLENRSVVELPGDMVAAIQDTVESASQNFSAHVNFLQLIIGIATERLNEMVDSGITQDIPTKELTAMGLKACDTLSRIVDGTKISITADIKVSAVINAIIFKVVEIVQRRCDTDTKTEILAEIEPLMEKLPKELLGTNG